MPTLRVAKKLFSNIVHWESGTDTIFMFKNDNRFSIKVGKGSKTVRGNFNIYKEKGNFYLSLEPSVYGEDLSLKITGDPITDYIFVSTKSTGVKVCEIVKKYPTKII